jgi:hypothetical protein
MIRLHDAEVEFATADTGNVGHAAIAGRGVALDAVVSCTTVKEAADRLTGDVVNASLATGADGDEFLFGLYGRCSRSCLRVQRTGPMPGIYLSWELSFFCLLLNSAHIFDANGIA